MNSFFGQISEKLGRQVNKAILLRYQGEIEATSPKFLPDGKTQLKVNNQPPLKVWGLVGSHYFRNGERFWKRKKDEMYELHIQNTSYERGEVNVQFIDQETGNPVGLTGTTLVAYPPKVLSRMNKAEHINAAVNAAKGINISIWLTIGVGVIMLILGIFVGMSGLGAQLNHAIQGNQTATVHSIIAGWLR